MVSPSHTLPVDPDYICRLLFKTYSHTTVSKFIPNLRLFSHKVSATFVPTLIYLSAGKWLGVGKLVAKWLFDCCLRAQLGFIMRRYNLSHRTVIIIIHGTYRSRYFYYNQNFSNFVIMGVLSSRNHFMNAIKHESLKFKTFMKGFVE